MNSGHSSKVGFLATSKERSVWNRQAVIPAGFFSQQQQQGRDGQDKQPPGLVRGRVPQVHVEDQRRQVVALSQDPGGGQKAVRCRSTAPLHSAPSQLRIVLLLWALGLCL